VWKRSAKAAPQAPVLVVGRAATPRNVEPCNEPVADRRDVP
jgi:hypothetical protein